MPTSIQKIRTFVHPANPRAKIEGIRLGTGNVVEEEDVFFASGNGSWEQAPIGAVITDGSVLWIRRAQK